MSGVHRAVAAALLSLLAAAGARADGAASWVLALSWSPTFCATAAGRHAPLQCGPDAERSFIVHGLWPNDDDGGDGADCKSPSRPSRADVDAVLDLMPSRGLVEHEWRTHGACSGLAPGAYFRTLRAAWERIAIPPGLATLRRDSDVRPAVLLEAFVRANAGLTADAVALRCADDRLEEVRFCLTRELDFTPCAAGRSDTCRARLIGVPAPE